MTRDAPLDVAVIGGGACGLATLLQLVEKAPSGARITLFENNMSTGPGLAYSEACDGTHVNMHTNTMSILARDPDHFARWIKSNTCATGRTDFPSRKHYGSYLSALVTSASELARPRNIQLTITKAEVVDVQRQAAGWTIRLSTGSEADSVAVVLAVGNFTSSIHKHLRGKPLYFDRPWPNHRLLDIPKDASICILGSRLTAIDEALYLVDRGYTGSIHLASRTGQLPKVQGTTTRYDRSFALHNLARELENTRNGGIITIAKRLHDEIRGVGASSSSSLALSDTPESVVSQFRLDVECARAGEVPGQSVLRATAPVIERYWKCLDEGSQQAFLREYMSEWVIHRHAMPLHTAEKVLRLLESGQLHVERIKPNTSIQWEDDAFLIPTSTAGDLRCKSLIEAIGLEYDATKVESPLMQNLLSRKTLRPHQAGGVHVDFDTLEAEKGLYVIGSMTRGVHFYSTAIDRNVVHAERMVDSILGLPARKPLHVAFFVGSDLFSQLMVSQLVPRLLAHGHIPFIYLPMHKASKRSQLFELREMGFYERSLLQDHVIPYLGSNCDNAGPCMTAQQLRAKYGILVQNVPDVNSKDFVRTLASNHIDVGYSIRCYHRFKTDIISYFQSQKGLWNLHPGVLPAYRGVMTTIRAMANREKEFGYSMHEINEDWDAGALVDIRKHAIDYSKPMLNYMDDVWRMGVDMVDELTDKIARDCTPKTLPQDEKSKGYYTFPTKDELAGYHQQGLRLVEGEGIKDILIRSFAPEAGEAREKLADVVEKACTAWYNENSAP